MSEISRCEVDKLFTSFYEEAISQEQPETTGFDPISRDLFHKIILMTKNNEMGLKISYRQLSHILGTKINRLRRRLLLMARFGIIKMISPWRDDDTGLREIGTIYINPSLYASLVINKSVVLRKMLVTKLVKLGIERLDEEDDTQGFNHTCLYGREEPHKSADRAEVQLINMMDREDKAKADKARTDALWRERSDLWVTGSAELWVQAQSLLGMGASRPNWEGPIGLLSPTAKRERSELVKTYQSFGGRITGLAWYIFCCGIPQRDKYGKLLYSPEEPHRQFITVDRKPSQFTKHFNAIMKDPEFLKIAKEDFTKFKIILQKYFGGVLDVSPRGRSEIDLLGFTLGDE